MNEGSTAIAYMFSILLFPEIATKSKEELIEYIDVIKESGKITEGEYKKAIKFIDEIYGIKELLKEKLNDKNI